MVATADRGTLIRARRSGACAHCGCDFAVGDQVYFSRESGTRHRRCVDRTRDDAGRAPDARCRAANDVDRSDAAVGGDDARDAGFSGDAGGDRPATPEPARDGNRETVRQILDLVIEAQERNTEALRRVCKLLS